MEERKGARDREREGLTDVGNKVHWPVKLTENPAREPKTKQVVS